MSCSGGEHKRHLPAHNPVTRTSLLLPGARSAGKRAPEIQTLDRQRHRDETSNSGSDACPSWVPKFRSLNGDLLRNNPPRMSLDNPSGAPPTHAIALRLHNHRKQPLLRQTCGPGGSDSLPRQLAALCQPRGAATDTQPVPCPDLQPLPAQAAAFSQSIHQINCRALNATVKRCFQ